MYFSEAQGYQLKAAFQTLEVQMESLCRKLAWNIPRKRLFLSISFINIQNNILVFTLINSYPHALPNRAHHFITELEQLGKDVTVVTQNIDGLHQLAGNSKVLELHGNVQTNYCTHCKKIYDLEEIKLDKDGIPRCPLDNHIVRPDIVMYGEALDSSVITEAVTAIQNADLMMIAGTSLIVYPASTFVDFFNGKTLAVINKTPIRTIRNDALIFEDAIGKILKSIKL